MKQKYIRNSVPLQPDDRNGARRTRAISSTQEPRVQIVVVHYGDQLLTLECLQSLAGLSYGNYQILIIDNGSEENRPELCIPDVPNAAVIQNRDNTGFAAACNQGIRAALENKADYVWILNNDTAATPQSLTTLVTEAENNRQLGAVGSVLVEQESEIHGGSVSFLTGLPCHLTNGKKGAIDYLCGASLLLRMQTLQAVGLFDTSFFLYWEDTDLCFRIRKDGWNLAIAEGSRVHHRGSSSSVFQSIGYDFHITASSIHFFYRHCRFWLLPVCISVTGKLLRRAMLGKFGNARAVLRGFLKGCRHRAGSNALSFHPMEHEGK